MDPQTWKLVLEYIAARENPRSSDLEINTLEQGLKDWAGHDPERQYQLEQALSIWQDTAQMPDEESWKDSFHILKQQLNQVPAKKVKMFKWWPAAAIAATVTGALVFLVFAGKKVWSISQEPVVWATRSADAGKIVNVILPDGSEISLNSGSSISFPQNLKHAALRTVKLNGEAFFKVKRDPAHPFVVQSQNIQTRVLGTSFNIQAWKNHRPEVTVLTGKVAVSVDSAGRQVAVVHLLPNQKAVYDTKSAQLRRENVEDASTYTGWRTGKMVFDKTPMEEVFESISRKYAVKIVSDHSFDNCKLTAKFDNVSMKEVMRTIELTFDIHYTINKQTIYIKGGKCN